MFPSGVYISRRFERTAPGCRVGSAVAGACVLRRHLRALARDLWDRIWDVAVTCELRPLGALETLDSSLARAKFLGFREAFPLPKVLAILYTPLCELQTVCCRGPMKAIKSSSRSRLRPTCLPIVHCCLEVVIVVESASGPTINLDC